MLPILLGVGAAALALLSGCTDSRKTPESQGPSGDSGGSPADAAKAETPPSPKTPPYFISFGNDLRAADIYQRLAERKVSDSLLDRGCLFPRSLFYPPIQRAQDHRIEACEIYEFALENSSQYPELAQTIAGANLPWALDAGLREKVQAAIQRLHESPGIKGLNRESEIYRKKMAIALSYFVDFPARPFPAMRNDSLKAESEELTRLNLEDFQGELLERGGLDGLNISRKPSASWIGNATEAYQSRSGGAGARAKLLFGVLAEAGLHPVFIFTGAAGNSDFVAASAPRRPFLLNFGGKRSEDFRVAVPLDKTDDKSGRPQLLVVPGLKDQAPTQDVTELSLATYLAMDFHEAGDRQLLRAEGDPAGLYKMALNLWPMDSAVFNSIGVTLRQLENQAQAEVALKEALRLDPTNASASYNLGRLYVEQGKTDLALRSFLNVTVFSPELLKDRAATIEPVLQKILAQDPSNLEASSIASKLKELREENPSEKSDAQ